MIVQEEERRERRARSGEEKEDSGGSGAIQTNRKSRTSRQDDEGGCAPLAEWFVLGPCVVSLEESPSSSPSRPAKLCISFVGVK